MAKTWYNGKVIKIVDESPTTKRFWVEVEGVDKLDFKAGQFVTMELPIHEKRHKSRRSYSIANHPDGSNVLEFCIVYLEKGLATTYFFNEVEIGTIIKFLEPKGIFTLREPVAQKDLVMICTGTGIAPFRSMIWDLYHHKKTYKSIHLIFGTRHEEGILYRSEFEKLVEEMPNVKFSVALSRAENLPENPNWDSYKGYVHQIYLEKYKEVDTNLDFYLCGWMNMVDEATANLKELGYGESQIHAELYG